MTPSPAARRSAGVFLAVSAALLTLTTTPSLCAQTAPAPAQTAPAATPAVTDPATLVGKTAPDFTLPDQNDKLHSLKDSRGKWTVVAFYPADMTTGCTFQNISYTRTSDKFAPLNAQVYTVSTQDTASKKMFCSKDSLTHTLLADVGGKTASSYDVLNGKVAKRVTFYIAPDGTIKKVDKKINTKQAGEDSLAILKDLEAAAATPAAP